MFIQITEFEKKHKVESESESVNDSKRIYTVMVTIILINNNILKKTPNGKKRQIVKWRIPRIATILRFKYN